MGFPRGSVGAYDIAGLPRASHGLQRESISAHELPMLLKWITHGLAQR